MAIDHAWIVKVTDDKGAVITGATVAIVTKASTASALFPYPSVTGTHAELTKGSGLYESTAIKPAPGDWLLIVRSPGKSPVVQPFTMKDVGGGEFVSAAGVRALTVKMTSNKPSPPGTLRRTNFEVVMFPSQEVVLLSGTEYFSAGTRMRVFAEDRRDVLRDLKVVNDGCIMTLFSCDDRAMETSVAGSPGWVKIGVRDFGGGDMTFVDSKGKTQTIVPGQAHPPVVGKDISITDLYAYLVSVATAEPGRVLEVSIFSHAYPGGPILFNTSDPNPRTGARLVRDFDGRAKDFSPPNVTRSMSFALANTGSYRIWGCSATTQHRNNANAAVDHAADPPNTMFEVQTSLTHHATGAVYETTRERTSREKIDFQMDRQLFTNSYPAQAAQFFARKALSVWGAAPGMGSSFGVNKGRHIMYVSMGGPPPTIPTTNPKDPPHTQANVKSFKYFLANHKQEPTKLELDAGYIDYQFSQWTPRFKAPPFDPKFFELTKNTDDHETTLVISDQSITFDSELCNLTDSQTTGLGAPGVAGTLYTVTHPTPSKSRAFFVQPDGAVFELRKDASNKFILTSPGTRMP